jgi:hypothetical protein
MRVIGAGFSRTGTYSFKSALEKLGYRTYHMEEAVKEFERGDLDTWNALMEGTDSVDWHTLLQGYDAGSDLPFAWYYEEVMEAFPEAKVVLTVRDPEKWWPSLAALANVHDTLVEQLQFLPRFAAFQRCVRNIIRVIFDNIIEQEANIAVLNQHVEEVKATVPADRLLVFSVAEGWEPLCNFLGHPVPDEPFPHENVGAKGAEALIQAILLQDLVATSTGGATPELQQQAKFWLEQLAKQAPPPG